MTNIIELRKELCDIFDQLRAKKIKVPQARELVNTAGKIIHSVRLELEYAEMRREIPVVEFLGGEQAPVQRARAPIALVQETDLRAAG